MGAQHASSVGIARVDRLRVAWIDGECPEVARDIEATHRYPAIDGFEQAVAGIERPQIDDVGVRRIDCDATEPLVECLREGCTGIVRSVEAKTVLDQIHAARACRRKPHPDEAEEAALVRWTERCPRPGVPSVAGREHAVDDG